MPVLNQKGVSTYIKCLNEFFTLCIGSHGNVFHISYISHDDSYLYMKILYMSNSLLKESYY